MTSNKFYHLTDHSLLDNAPKLGVLSKRDLTISGSEGSYIPVPSPLGKIRSMTKEKIDVLFLRSNLPYQYHISLNDLECLETVGSGNYYYFFNPKENNLFIQFSFLDMDTQFFFSIFLGSFGRVYKGLYKGQTVAVKRYRTKGSTMISEVCMFFHESLLDNAPNYLIGHIIQKR